MAAADRSHQVRLSAVVMTHPARLEHARRLQDRYPELDLDIVVDPAPEEGPCALRTARLAWQSVADGATHHLVLQDDAVPCADFASSLLRAVAAAPDAPISLHTDWGNGTSYAVRVGALLGRSWAPVTDGIVPTIGHVLPAELARQVSRFQDYDGPHDDVALRRFLATVRIPAVATVPNLIEHAPLPSIAGHDHLHAARSACWLPDPGAVDWNLDAPQLDGVPFMSWHNGALIWLTPPGNAGEAWDSAPPQDVLGRRGLHWANIMSIGRSSVRPYARSLPDLDEMLLFTLWLTAYGLGAVTADLAGEDGGPVDRLLARPAAAQALATLPGGALRFILDGPRLEKATSDLNVLVDQALRRGFDMVRNTRRSPTAFSRCAAHSAAARTAAAENPDLPG